MAKPSLMGESKMEVQIDSGGRKYVMLTPEETKIYRDGPYRDGSAVVVAYTEALQKGREVELVDIRASDGSLLQTVHRAKHTVGVE